MDERFPRWLRRVVSALSFLSLPNLGPLICGLAILGFIGSTMLQAPMDRFVFDPQAVLRGEWWRFFAFPTLTEPIWLLFFCMYVYFVYDMLEKSWGEAPVTIFTLFSYIMAIVASLVTGQPLPVWIHVLQNVSLAFGTLFPDMELMLFFVLPVKAKYLAMFSGALFVWQFIMGSGTDRLFLFLVMLPYIVFFLPMGISAIRTRRKINQNRKRFDDFR